MSDIAKRLRASLTFNIVTMEQLQRDMIQVINYIEELESRSLPDDVIDWLFKRCKVVYFPNEEDGVPINDYPIEHSPFSNKDARDSILSVFNKAREIKEKYGV